MIAVAIKVAVLFSPLSLGPEPQQTPAKCQSNVGDQNRNVRISLWESMSACKLGLPSLANCLSLVGKPAIFAEALMESLKKRPS